MSSTNAGSGNAKRVLQIDKYKWLWIVDESVLYVGDLKNPSREVNPAKPTFLLPVLESSPKDVLSLLRSVSAQIYGDERLSVLFPVKEVIGEAIEGRSDYWAELALRWIDVLGAAEFVELLVGLSAASWAPQSIRHHAKRLLRAAQ